MSDVQADPAGESRMTLMEHLQELRRRLIYAALVLAVVTGACFTFAPQLFEILRGPLARLPAHKLVTLQPLEMFVTYIKLSLVSALFLTSPWLLLQVWLFVAPGLHRHEKRWIAPFVILGTAFFVGGASFAYYLVLPIGFEYLVNMVPAHVEATYSVAEYYSLVIQLLLAFGVVFELPLLMWILSAARVVKPETWSRMRKYWIVMAFVIGGVLTPPDPLTQIMMAVPLLIFFEIGAFGARLLYRRAATAPATTSPA